MKFFFKWYDFAHPLDYEAMFRIDLYLTSRDQLPCCIDEDSSEYIDNPMKILDKRDSCKDKYNSEKYRSKYSPE